MITLKKKVYLAHRGRGRRQIEDQPSPSQTVPPGRIPRVSRVMALAIHFDELLRAGTVVNTIEMARLLKVTQPRITQVMNLLHLAPDIQEELLFLPGTLQGSDPVHEKRIRRICKQVHFTKQRCMWEDLKRGHPMASV